MYDLFHDKQEEPNCLVISCHYICDPVSGLSHFIHSDLIEFSP